MISNHQQQRLHLQPRQQQQKQLRKKRRRMRRSQTVFKNHQELALLGPTMQRHPLLNPALHRKAPGTPRATRLE